MIGFLNLFFIPMIGLYIFRKRNKKKTNCIVDFIMEYGVFSVAVFVGAKVIYKLINIFAALPWNLEAGYYTAFALISAVLAAFIFEFFAKYISVKVNVEANEKE